MVARHVVVDKIVTIIKELLKEPCF